MKEDRICFNKTLTYLVLLIAAVVGAFYVISYSNTQKLGGTPKAGTPLLNKIRYPYLGTDNKVVNPNGVATWPAGGCEYRLRSYKEGSKTLSENAYTGFKSNGTILEENTDCYPYIYAQRDIRYNYIACGWGGFTYNEYCRGRVNTLGDVKYGGLFYSYAPPGGFGLEVYQQTSTLQTVAGQTGKWWVADGTIQSTSKMIILTKRTFEGFPAYLAGSNTAFTPAPVIKKCTYDTSVIKFADESPAVGEYYIDGVNTTTTVKKDEVKSVKQENGAINDKLTAIQCIPLADGAADVVSWKSNGGTASNDLNLQTCKDNAVKTYTVSFGGVPQIETIRAVCKYKTRSGTEVSVFYGDFIMNPDGTPTKTKCDCDETRDPVLTYPTFVERP
ncbi:MAG: hypothetical protein US40_C0007G0008 [Candidatus Roizmanbacteria bacterium GW2011_GWC2_37_13]|uniref:Uncharacterized protein n=1 Tax=Candidatus Roizmanbacteria bacterium GW2011_GWC2_37_13 TaxID=1618486 RepID=A0A0G0IMS5_9BACT|nr:MAG: hypothetical protein US38_C0012G0011 [Candidatus Roizmanbacteria bacterium GW2011_GWC1_37_12]KKQ25509.1 MAG: hypothetical protein US40_C0007G0008 [Candidatus Roizmanbacteria bacterium GW2011_GWC2_37_13]